jgi:hypothetical protein
MGKREMCPGRWKTDMTEEIRTEFLVEGKEEKEKPETQTGMDVHLSSHERRKWQRISTNVTASIVEEKDRRGRGAGARTTSLVD